MSTLYMSSEGDARPVPLNKPRSALFFLSFDKVNGSVNRFFVYGLHSLFGEGSGIFKRAVSSGLNAPSWTKVLSKTYVLSGSRLSDNSGSSSALRWYRLPKIHQNHDW